MRVIVVNHHVTHKIEDQAIASYRRKVMRGVTNAVIEQHDGYLYAVLRTSKGAVIEVQRARQRKDNPFRYNLSTLRRWPPALRGQ